jgi:peptide/nickel transport system substrate-binding protein
MNKRYILGLILPLILLSCGKTPKGDSGNDPLKQAKGGKTYGGVFRVSETEYIKTLFPPSITDAFSYRVASQVYEGLFKFDPATLEVVPGLVAEYAVDKSRTQYTFKLKPGVYFHDDACFEGGKGREVTAEDVKYCFTQLCTQSATNQNFSLLSTLKGAEAYYAATGAGKQPGADLASVKVVDKYTVQLQLEKPSSILFYNLARPGTFIYPREAYEKYSAEMRIKAVGTGPFQLTDVEENISIVLKRHNRYHGTDSLGNQLPFLSAVSIQFIKDKKTELFEFKKGNLDILYRLPTEYIIEILEEMSSKQTEGSAYSQYELQREPEMNTQFLAFHTQDGIFKDVNLRKAFSYAIDRENILEFTLNGEGFAPGLHGVTPPAFNNYTINNIKGYKLDRDSARYYLAKAGYPNGKGFPKITLQLNAEGARNTNVAVAVQKQLKENLNVDIELNVVPIAQSVENAIAGNFDFLRIAWQADYPNAENFLWIFYGKSVPADANAKSFPNIFRYKNDKFDRLYESAVGAKSIAEANQYFMQAEQVLMNDAPVIVLWYDEGYRLIQSYVKNFPNNPMQYRDLSQVWFDSSKIKQKQ